jgi:hypothetical protein
MSTGLIVYFSLSYFITLLYSRLKKHKKELIGYKQRTAFIILLLLIAPVAATIPDVVAKILSKINNFIKQRKEKV